jgi:hypothetical protein
MKREERKVRMREKKEEDKRDSEYVFLPLSSPRKSD